VNPAFVAMVRRLPKADLHCHLDGSLRPGTLFDLSVERGLSLPAPQVFLYRDTLSHGLVDPEFILWF
jgi:adenosine deaminase